MRDVITYPDMDVLFSSADYAFVRNCPQIAESSNLMLRMRGMGVTRVTTFGHILSEVDETWSEGRSVDDMAMMSAHLDERMRSASDDELLWLKGCSRRLYEMWSAIRLLEEAGAVQSDLVPDNRDEGLLLEMWDLLIERDQMYREFRAKMRSEGAVNVVMKCLGMRGPDDRPVVIHGFYYLTPIQERLVRLMEGAGMKLIFLIPYDMSYGYAHEVWRAFYREECGFKAIEEWQMVSEGPDNPFGDMLEGRPSSRTDYSIVEYGNLMDMIRDLSQTDSEAVSFYSPDDGTANEILQDFFPARYGRRTILSYPVGGFVSALHRMWDADSQSILINTDLMEECFVYGWVSDSNGRRSNLLLEQLHKLMPFFEGCNTVSEWDTRLELLHQIQGDVVSIFRSDASEEGVRRREDIMGNPFVNLSMFDVDEADTDSITEIMRNLLGIAKELFQSGPDADLKEHVTKLKKVLKEGNDMSTAMEEEYSLIEALLQRVESNHRGRRYQMTDISRAMGTYLANDYRTVDADSVAGWVRPMYEMDGNDKQDTHILLCDMDRLPGQKASPQWPLSRATMDRIRAKQAVRDKVPLMGFAMFILDISPIANRYLVFSAFRNGHVTLSWVGEMDNKFHAPSPYIELMGEVGSNSRESPTIMPIEVIQPEMRKIEGMSLGGIDMIPEARMDFALCHRRFLYGYMLDAHPSYSTKFNQEFAVGGLVSALRNLRPKSKDGEKEIEDNVRELFPNLPSVELQNIFDKAHRKPDTSYDRFGDREYTAMRNWVQFPAPLSDIIKERMDEPVPNGETQMTAGSSNETVCMYCPHREFCRVALHKGDDDD